MAEDAEVDVVEFRAPGPAVAARLDIMGIDSASVLARMDDQLVNGQRPEDALTLPDSPETIDQVNALRKSLGGRGWVDRLASAPEGLPHYHRSSREWLLQELNSWDVLGALRLILLTFPDAEVVLDITDVEETRYLDKNALKSLASRALAMMSDTTGMYAPVVVLTEGQTDAEFLRAGLEVLYPYLTDKIRFLDYETKPEGGAGALVKMVKAFHAAGIANRVVAVFDNDTAAADALRGKLSRQIRTIQYPAIDLAKEYPTLGPPTMESLEGSLSLADVNGLAGSIELYLGKDVLTRDDGTLCPVHWKSFIPRMHKYQGEILDKEDIRPKFRDKYHLALKNPACVREQDWDGLRLILDAIRADALSAYGE